MDTGLKIWQERLARHFTELYRIRSSEGVKRPIYALEHDLNLTEVQTLGNAIRTYIAENPPSLDHALAWVVYSAEIGYHYSGEEYWQTFEHVTPGWNLFGDRYWIRRCFHLFQREFGGAMPSGAWAEHFSIICWPITHAILPRDFQRQLAFILYHLRHLFSAELFESPSILGDNIAARSWNTTSRFQNFVQEKQLVGEIAAALLLQGELGTGNLIYPATLKRISDDLDKESRARELLQGARVAARDRAQIRNPLLVRRTTFPIRHPEDARIEVATLGIEPRLILRQKDSEGASWEVLLEIPDLSNLLVRFPNARDILMGSRCVVAGAKGRPLAREQCLHRSNRIGLKRWPRSDEVLINFEQKEPQIEFLLRTECLLPLGPNWLFKIGTDGYAHELRSLMIRPGKQYVLVSTSELSKSSDNIRQVNLECEGVHGILLDIPLTLTLELEEKLRSLGLGQAKTTEVWPAGLMAARWDGEGVIEWLSTDKPRLGIRADFHVTSISVEVENQKIDIQPSSAGAPVFIELPQFSPGVYNIQINALSGDKMISESGNLKLHIREPRPWSPCNSNGGAILVVVVPTTPTLEQLWEDKIEFQVQGPASHKILCHIAFLERGKNLPFFKKDLPPLTLPIDTAIWRKHFDQYFKNQKDVQGSYDLAHSCLLKITSGELGTFSLTTERDFSPLRWIVRWTKDGLLLRLLDDSGVEMPKQLSRYEFTAPDIMIPLDAAFFNCTEGTYVASGLYVASIGKYQSSIVIAPKEVHDLKDLGVQPHVSNRFRTTQAIIDLIRIVDIWEGARVPGNLIGFYWRKKVMLILIHEIFRLIAGDNWAKDENTFQQSGEPLMQCIEKCLKNMDEVELAKKIFNFTQKYGITPKQRAQHMAAYSSIILHIRVPESAGVGGNGDKDSRLLWVTELVLRLASAARGTDIWAGEKLHQGISYILGEPSLARVARVVVLAVDKTHEKTTYSSDLYEEWSWG